MPASRTHQNGAAQFNQKLKNLFRINLNSGADRDREKSSTAHVHSSQDAAPTRPEVRSKFGSSFFKGTVGRLRTNTTASEGNPLDEALSPTAHANPYFAHQGQPGLRHHNNESVPPSPPDTPNFKIQGPDGGPEQTTSAGREELARKLRRVASAPNAQGLFSKGKGSAERPATAELAKDPLLINKDSGTLEMVDSASINGSASASNLGVPDKDTLGNLPPPNRNSLAFRRTYSSNSIKVRDVEVGPQSFDKIKLIGKGDVGKVYLVREKKSSRLYAMKGIISQSQRVSPT